ncbi:MAG TPA: N-6 DNA methylase, partial [Blastocatellia bacterium]|nr:N-6 DNA methylase [Blastocatellia bacterium]
MVHHQAKEKDERHRYGRHYTPLEVARLLAAFAVRSAGDLVLDPSCGDGRLLEEALKLKKQLASRDSTKATSFSDDLFGVEHSRPAAQVARRTGATVVLADFFDVEPGRTLNSSVSRAGKEGYAPRSMPREFDALIGNPPYIRQEIIGLQDKSRIAQRLAVDRSSAPESFWPRWSGRSDIYVYFFAHSIRFLKERGRLVFLTASSWLDSAYGAALREFLLNNFRVLAVVESAAESFFADASINTCITVLERDSDLSARERNSIRFVRFNKPLREIVREASPAQATLQLAREIVTNQNSRNNEAYRVR